MCIRRQEITMRLADVSIAAAALALVCACQSDRAYDCHQICTTYKTCADANYDDRACAARCEDQAAASESFENRADTCQVCIDGRSCLAAVFSCTNECAGIVP